MEAQTLKKSVIGIFDRVHAIATPLPMKLGVYARLTDLDGTYTFKIRVVGLLKGDSGGGEELGLTAVTAPTESSDPLAAVELAMNFSLAFPRFGRYEVQLLSNDIYLGRALVSIERMANQRQ